VTEDARNALYGQPQESLPPPKATEKVNIKVEELENKKDSLQHTASASSKSAAVPAEKGKNHKTTRLNRY
jgi:hypothetical protein